MPISTIHAFVCFHVCLSRSLWITYSYTALVVYMGSQGGTMCPCVSMRVVQECASFHFLHVCVHCAFVPTLPRRCRYTCGPRIVIVCH